MMRALILSLLTASTAACTFPQPYEADPASPIQWQRRQEAIERREAERVRLCRMMNKDSESHEEMCRRPGDPS